MLNHPPGRNYCFLNTGLQQLKYTPYLADYLTSGQYRHNLRSDIRLEESLAVALSSFFQLSALASPGEVISPEVVHTILGKVDSRFNNYQQHDAAEAMATILDRLTYETSSVKTKIEHPERLEGESVLDHARRYHEEYKSKENNSPLVDTLHCVQVSKVTCDCSKCGHYERQTCDPLPQFALEIPTNEDGRPVASCSVKDLMDEHTKPQEVPDFKCPTCERRLVATRQLTILGCPPILMITPRKYQEIRNGEGKFIELKKIDVSVDVSLDVNDFSECMTPLDNDVEAHYELCSSANQCQGGSLGGGHYVSTVRDFKSDTFHCFNDSRHAVVSSDNKSSIINSTNYNLLFVRRDVVEQLRHSGAQLPQDEQNDKPIASDRNGSRVEDTNGGSDSDVHMDADVGSVPNEAAKKIEFQDLVKQAEDAHLIESYSEAADLCTLALGIYSDNVEALILRVRANLRLKEWQSVISDTMIILSIDSTNVKMVYSRGNARMKLGKYKEALDDFNVALTLSPSAPEIAMLKRNIAVCTKHLPVSIDVSDDLDVYETIEEDDSPTPTDDMIVCMIALEEEDYDEVIRVATNIISADSTSYKWNHIRGLAHQALGNYKDAFNDYMEADSLDPTDEIRRVLNARGKECLEKLKDYNLFKLISDSSVPPESLKDFSKNDILKARRFFEQDNLENLAKTTLGNMSRFIPVTTRSASTNYTRCGVVGSFPVIGQHAEEHGPLYSRGRNVIPQGPTPLEFFRAMRVLLMQQHGVSSELANIIAMHSFVWVDFVPFTLDKKASTKGVDHENYETLKKSCEGAIIKYISDVVAQLHLTHIMVIGRHAKEFVEKHRDKLFSSEVKVYYCLHPSKMSMGASNHEVFDALTTMNEMIYDLRGEECKPINIELMENNFQTYIRDPNVYVALYDGVDIFYSPGGRDEMENMIREKGGTFRMDNFPTQADFKSGKVKEVAGLTLKMYAHDSDEAVKLRDMKPGPQTGTDEFKEWEKQVKRPELFVHSVDLDTLKVVSIIGEPASTIIGINKCGNINITNRIVGELNKDLKKIDLNFGRGNKPAWSNWKKAKKSIEKGLSLLIWLRIEEQVPGANVVSHPSGDSYHLPFILSGVQLDPGTPATVKCKEVGVLALDEDDFKTEVAKLKVLPKNKRLQYKTTANKCCKIKGCKSKQQGKKDHLCSSHHTQFKKAGRDTTEGDS